MSAKAEWRRRQASTRLSDSKNSAASRRAMARKLAMMFCTVMLTALAQMLGAHQLVEAAGGAVEAALEPLQRGPGAGFDELEAHEQLRRERGRGLRGAAFEGGRGRAPVGAQQPVGHAIGLFAVGFAAHDALGQATQIL